MDRKIEGYYFGDTNRYFNYLWFLSKIMWDDDYRDHLQNIYVDDKNIVSTDCSILATLGNNANLEIEPGYYKPIYGRNFIILKKENEPETKYPNYDRVIPDYQDSFHNCVTLNLDCNREEMIYRIARNIRLKLNTNYLKLIPPGDYDIYFQDDEKKAVVFVSGMPDINFKIVIAPMRKENDGTAV